MFAAYIHALYRFKVAAIDVASIGLLAILQRNPRLYVVGQRSSRVSSSGLYKTAVINERFVNFDKHNTREKAS